MASMTARLTHDDSFINCIYTHEFEYGGLLDDRTTYLCTGSGSVKARAPVLRPEQSQES